MYAGQLVESGPAEASTQHPAHPYTQLLLDVRARPGPARAGAEVDATSASRRA